MRDTPISEQAILGAAMGAAMTGLKPIAEIMFSDFIAVCFDYIANEFPKSRYMTNGQVKCPLVVRTGNGAGSRFGAQHSQSVENWCMMIPGLKVVAPSSPRDVIGLMAAAVRDPDPVIFFEHKSLYAIKGEVPDGEIVDTLGTAKILRPGKDATILALALMVPRALEAAERLKAEHGIDCEVVDVRSLVPLDTQTILGSVARTAPPVHGRGKSAAVRLGRGDRLDRRRRGVLRSRRPAGAHHHAAYSAAGRRSCWKTWCCRMSIASPRRCGGRWGVEHSSSSRHRRCSARDPVSRSDGLRKVPALQTRRVDAARATGRRKRKVSAMYDNLLANVPTDLWIGGKWRKSSDNARFDVIDPATEKKVASVASATPRGCHRSGRCRATPRSPAWAAKKPRERGEILRKAFELIMRDAERLAKLITLENGKALPDSRGEVAYAAEFFRWYAEEAVRNLGQMSTRAVVGRAHPGAAQAGRRRRAGDAVEFSGGDGDAQDRPGARGRLPGRAQARLRYAAHHAGADADPGRSRRAGGRRQRHPVALARARSSSAMLHDPRVRVVSFTGSTEVGRKLLHEAADNIVKPAMELGGNAPFIVFEDADIDAAIDGAMIAKMRNMGEACTAANRFYVHEKVHDEFAKKLTDKMQSLKMGNGLDDGVDARAAGQRGRPRQGDRAGRRRGQQGRQGPDRRQDAGRDRASSIRRPC